MADAGFDVSASVDGWADDDDDVVGLCLTLVVGIMIGVIPSSSSSRMELVFAQQTDVENDSNYHNQYQHFITSD